MLAKPGGEPYRVASQTYDDNTVTSPTVAAKLLPTTSKALKKAIVHLPKDIYGQLLRRYVDFVDVNDRKIQKSKFLVFMVYALAIALTVSIQIGLLGLVAASISDTHSNTDDLVVALRPIALAVVYLCIITTDLQNATVMFRLVDVISAEEDKSDRKSLFLIASLATIQYGTGIGVLWLSFLVISASTDTISTISNALVVTFVLQVDDYMGQLLHAQDIHRQLERIADPTIAREWGRARLLMMYYTLVVLLLPFLLCVLFLLCCMLVISAVLAILFLSRSVARVFLNVFLYYMLLPTVIFAVCLFRLPQIGDSGAIVLIAVVLMLVIHGMSMMLPLIRHESSVNVSAIVPSQLQERLTTTTTTTSPNPPGGSHC